MPQCAVEYALADWQILLLVSIIRGYRDAIVMQLGCNRAYKRYCHTEKIVIYWRYGVIVLQGGKPPYT